MKTGEETKEHGDNTRKTWPESGPVALPLLGDPGKAWEQIFQTP